MLALSLLVGMLLQVAAAPTTGVDLFSARPFIETGVLGALLYIVLTNQERRFTALLKQSEERYAALLHEMAEVMKRDVESRAAAMRAWDGMKDTKFCVYELNEAKAIAAQVIKMQQKGDAE